MTPCKLIAIVAVVAVVGVPGAVAAPKRKSSSSSSPPPPSSSGAITYNEKQKGDYNIRLHMKDFQIIALLGDDPLGGFDDYDYNYDYADLTVKPVLPTFTLPPVRPSNGTGSGASTNRPADAAVNPSTTRPLKPAEILLLLAQQSFPTVTPIEQPDSVEHKVTTNAQINITVTGEKVTTTTEKSVVGGEAPAQELTIPVVVLQPTLATGTNTSPRPEKSDDEKRPVEAAPNATRRGPQPKPFLYVPQILFDPERTQADREETDPKTDDKRETDDKKNPVETDDGDDKSESGVAALAQSPTAGTAGKRGDETSMATTLPVKKRPGFSSGSVRMCALGFTRDKRGRCRRVRRPGQQVQYGVRLANMANQLKSAMTPVPAT